MKNELSNYQVDISTINGGADKLYVHYKVRNRLFGGTKTIAKWYSDEEDTCGELRHTSKIND